MASNTEIANYSLGHLGVTKEIQNLDTENSAEAIVHRRFFDLSINAFQKEFPYAFATKQQALGLITEDPNNDYKYEYTYPSDCQIAGKIVSGLRNDNRQSRPHMKITRGTSGKVIWTDCQDAVLEYQIIETDEGRYDDDFVLAYSFLLAWLCAPALTSGDPFGLGERARAAYYEFKSTAKSNSSNEEQEEQPSQAEWIRAREGDVDTASAQDWTAFPINVRVTS